MSAAQVLIGGDVCPVGRNLAAFARGDADGLLHDLLGEFATADLAIANLECPLIETPTPIRKTGPVLAADSACINGLRASKIRALGLANNHILDHGAPGLENTLRVCARAGIHTFGAGPNLAEARRILVLEAGGIRFGLLGLAEQEWSIATEQSAGANPLDLIDCTRNLQSQRHRFDYLIVLLHGGNEQYPFPSPRLMEVCRFLIEQGARAVVCQHSHCAGCCESYRDGHIVYGQGNLLFDCPGQPPDWREGFLVRLSVPADLRSTMELIPFEQSGSAPGARRMTPAREQAFRKEIAQRSLAIQDRNFVRQTWREFCKQFEHDYLSALLGHGRLLRWLNRRGHVVKYFPDEETLLSMQNGIRCDSHREVLLTVLEQYRKQAGAGVTENVQ